MLGRKLVAEIRFFGGSRNPVLKTLCRWTSFFRQGTV